MIENLFLSAGAIKAGTTWVNDKLQHHPQLHFSREKEIYYFSHVNGVANSLDVSKLKRRANQGIVQLSQQFKQRKISLPELKEGVEWYTNYSSDVVNDEWYFNLFDNQAKENPTQFCADFSNLTCLLDNDGWEHVHRLAKNIKVIYILRDPIARLWSHYKFHLQFTGHQEQNTPEQNIRLFKRILAKPWFIRNSMYSKNLQKMKESLPEKDFKVFYLEDFSEKPLETLKQVHTFLEIDDYDYPDLDLQARKNTSISKSIPKEWLEVINLSLEEEVNSLRNMNVWHDSWSK